MKYLAVLFFFANSGFFLFAQQDVSEEKRVDHLTFYDTFFGEEGLNQVCYPKDHQNFFFAIFGLMLLTIVLAGVIIYSRSRYTRKINENALLVSKRNCEIEESLRYALGIQRTILPSDEEFKKHFQDSFIFYRPKDIVSGDFYYCTEVGTSKFVAVIDCTGHGVPGAFLSLIGYQALNRSIHDDKLTKPNDILSQMNKYVKRTLKQMEESSIQDGMVISLVKIDYVNDQLDFAGAGMDLLMVKDEEIIKVKGNRLTVGTDEKHVKSGPENHEFRLSSYSRLFMYSDGVVDQFGNTQEKFKTKRLLEFLGKSVDLDMKTIGGSFTSLFSEWQGKEEQIDDVTLIGIHL